MDSSTRRSLRPYIASAYHLNFHSEDNASASAKDICERLCSFLCGHKFARAIKRTEAKCGDGKRKVSEASRVEKKTARCDGVHFGLRSLLRLLNKRFVRPDSEQIAQQQRVLLVLLDGSFVKPTALRHVFALLALGSNSPPFFLLPGLSNFLSVPLNLSRLSTITFTSNCPSELILLLDQMRIMLKPIELVRRSTNAPPAIDILNNAFETPKLVRPAGKKKRKAMRRTR